MRENCPSSLRKPFIFLTLFLITPMVAFAGDEVAEVYVGPDKIVFEPLIENEGFSLSFGDECEVLSWKFDRGETPVLYAYDSEGKPLHDGAYTWELQSRPVVDPEIAELLHKSRKYNDTQLPIELKREGLLPEGRSQTGYIIILEGKFVDVREQEENFKAADDVLPNKDFLILDDLIVDGSACIGFDCVNGESFGFDTIRLKENNLRIKFDDTSVAASFPRTDWQLTANDSANGGASKFSIDDISGGRTPFTVEANAPSHSLYVDDGGRVGFGTSTPVADLHVVDGDTPTLRLEQNGSSGFAPQTWDVAGNETNFFVRDASNGSTLPFRIRPGAPTSSVFIDVDGDTGVGTSSPDSDLHVIGSLMVAESDSGQTPAELMEIESPNDNGARIRFDDGNNWNAGGGAGNSFVILEASDAAEFVLNSAGDLTILGTLTENSDVNAKENFSRVDAQQVLAKVLDLPVTTWNYRDNSDEIRHLGPMAQDFYAAFGLGGTDQGIAPRNLAGVALVAIQGLNEELVKKDSQISDLEEQNAALTDRLAALEAMVQTLAAQQ